MSSPAPGTAASSTCATGVRSRCPAPIRSASTPAGSKTAWCGSTPSTPERNRAMADLDSLTQRVRSAVGEESGLDARIKFNFGNDGFLFIDGKSQPNQVSNADAPSDIALTVSMENFQRIIDKQLNPKFALMTGRMRLKGDIRIATRLDKVFGLD